MRVKLYLLNIYAICVLHVCYICVCTSVCMDVYIHLLHTHIYIYAVFIKRLGKRIGHLLIYHKRKEWDSKVSTSYREMIEKQVTGYKMDQESVQL